MTILTLLSLPDSRVHEHCNKKLTFSSLLTFSTYNHVSVPNGIASQTDNCHTELTEIGLQQLPPANVDKLLFVSTLTGFPLAIGESSKELAKPNLWILAILVKSI